MINKILMALLTFFIPVFTFAETLTDQPNSTFFTANGKFMVVTTVIFIIFVFIVLFLVNLERKISNLERKI